MKYFQLLWWSCQGLALGFESKIEAYTSCHSEKDCAWKDVVLDFPHSVSGFHPKFSWSLTANMTSDMSFKWRYHFTTVSGPAILPVKAWDEKGVACGYTRVGDLWWFLLGLVLPDCTAKAGPVKIEGTVNMELLAIPGIPTTSTLIVTDSDGKLAFHLAITVSRPLLEKISVPGFEVQNQLANAAWPSHDFRIGTFRQDSQFPIPLKITPSSCCDEQCVLKNMELIFPSSITDPTFNFSVSGEIDQHLTDLRFGLHGELEVLRELPQSIALGNGSFCGATTIRDPSFEIDLFPNSTNYTTVETCPVPAGRYVLHGRAKPPKPFIALGAMQLRVEITAGESKLPVACVDIDMRFSFGENGPAHTGNGPVLI